MEEVTITLKVFKPENYSECFRIINCDQCYFYHVAEEECPCND